MFMRIGNAETEWLDAPQLSAVRAKMLVMWALQPLAFVEVLLVTPRAKQAAVARHAFRRVVVRDARTAQLRLLERLFDQNGARSAVTVVSVAAPLLADRVRD
jgi:hypothetical protein